MKTGYSLKLLTTIAAIFCVASACAAGFNDDEQRMVDWIDANYESAIDLLEETVNIGSGTMNLQRHGHGARARCNRP